MPRPIAANPPRRFAPDPADAANVRAALDDITAGRTVELTPDELAEWERTGELPESARARVAALGCHDSHD
jgi:hypothetical protein